MGDRFEKALQDLNKQKEDIELLISSLEDAYAEAAITEKHYKELRTKNKNKLDEITDKIETVKSRQGKVEKRDLQEEKKEEEKKAKPKEKEKAKSPKPEKEAAAPKTPEEPKEKPKDKPPATPGPSEDIPEVPMGTPEPSEESPEVPIGTPEPTEGGGQKNITEDDFKRIMTKVFENAKLIDLAEISPKLEKVTAELEKMKAHIDAVREQKNTDTERSSRINEELGELRSGFHTNEGRLSEAEMKIKDHDITLSDLRPQKYTKSIRSIDRALKMHEGRLDKHDDLTNMIMKRITGIKDVLEQFGSMEEIAKMNKETSKKLISIDEREKRIRRISDKLDGIFSELNKRLDEFIFYKAKQDNVGELVDELLRNIDEMGTKLGKFAEKADLEILRENLEGKIAAGGPMQAGMSPEEKTLHTQRDELADLVSLLEEQHKKKTISDHEYDKAKAENTKRIADLDKKLAAFSLSSPAPSGTVPEEEPTETGTEPPVTEPSTETPEEPPSETAEPTGEPPTEKPVETQEEEPADETPETPEEETPTEEPEEPTPEEPPQETPEEEPAEEEPEEQKEESGLASMTGSALKKLESIANITDRSEKREPAEIIHEEPEEPVEEPTPEEPETPEETPQTSEQELPEEPAEEEPEEPTPEKPLHETPEEEPPPKEKQPDKPKKTKTVQKGKPTMLETLEESFKNGLITKAAYEKTKKVLEKKG